MDMRLFQNLILPYQFGFIRGHYYLDETAIRKIKGCLDPKYFDGVIKEYEKKFAALLGIGRAVSFASGRMAFFSLLKMLNIGAGDEIILPAFTCSVMPNAIWRTGAKPIFSDIDPDTFGSDPDSIERAINAKTKLIVAQHSFGIPCEIKKIMEVAKKRGIFVVEDCAISLDSAIGGVKVGNFGDAAFFSTDHTKPLNTIIGGMFYTSDIKLYEKIKKFNDTLPGLGHEHEERLYSQFEFERKNTIPDRYSRIIFKRCAATIMKMLTRGNGRNKYTFLEADCRRCVDFPAPYPYPAKMPFFLAQIGIYELNRWEEEREHRKALLRKYLSVSEEAGLSSNIPRAYFNKDLDIVPLRFVFKDSSASRKKHFLKFIDRTQVWFRQPVICCPSGPKEMGYIDGDSPRSEAICHDIINWPCALPYAWESKVIDLFRAVYT